jgi:CelD/BcsL family acetyltransferase involved in cellulose biosynthesis
MTTAPDNHPGLPAQTPGRGTGPGRDLPPDLVPSAARSLTAQWQPSRATSDGWHTEVRRDDDALGDLAAEWRDLYDHCATATPFQSHAWLASWWRFYGRPGRLRVVLVRRHGQLVAAAALLRRRRAGLAVLSPVGHGLSDLTDVLVHEEYPAEAARLLAGAMRAAAGGGVVDLPEVPPHAAAWRVARAWPASSWRLPASTCLELDAEPTEKVIARLSRATAKRLRNKLNNIERRDIEVRYVRSHDAAEAIGSLIELHELQWQGRRITPEHLQPRFAAHLSRAATQMIADGQALIQEYWRAGRLLGVCYMLIGKGFLGAYLYGIHPDLSAMVDVSTMLLHVNLSAAMRLECSVLNMLRGTEPYKLRWRPREVPNVRLILAGTLPPAAAAYTAAVRGRARAVAVLDSRTPWVRELVRGRGRADGAPVRAQGERP